MNKKKMPLGLIVQLVLVAILIVVLGLSMFWNFLLIYAEVIAGAALIVMAYNNQKVYNRKHLTWIYALFGVVLIITAIWKVFNG